MKKEYIKRVGESYKNHIVALVFGPLVKVLEAIFDLFIPLVMKAIIDLNQYSEPSAIPNSISSFIAKIIRLFGVWIKDNTQLNDAIVGTVIILIMAILGFLVTMLAQFIAASTAVSVGGQIRLSLYKKILSLSKKDKERMGNSYIQTVLNNDVYQVERGVLIFIRLIVRAPFIILGSIVFCFILDWKIGLAFAFIAPAVFISLFLILNKSNKQFSVIQKSLDDVTDKTTDTINGARVIKAFDSLDYETSKFSQSNDEYFKKSISVQKNNALINPIVFEITSLVTIFVIFILMPALFNSDAAYKVILTSSLIAAMAYLAQIFFATIQLSSVLLDLTKAGVSRRRINSVFSIHNSIVTMENPISKTVNVGEEILSFSNVYFSFDEKEEHFALEDVSFNIKKGNTIGIIGGTGSGKSTIINLIERFYNPSMGQIRYKGVELESYDLVDLRNNIGLVNQKSFLFNGSIRDNFLMAKPDATDKEIEQVLKVAEAYDFVFKMPNNIDSKVKEGGINLSGGQRQRLCIARALVKNPEILILDDSTSALDYLTDKNIRLKLKEMKDLTKIIISQRVSTICDCDLILVIDRGRVIGQGKHDDLMKTCNIYNEIAKSQMNLE